MPGTLQPLDQKFPVVDAQGRPTDYFTRWAQQKQIDIGASAQLDGGNDFVGDQVIEGGLTVQSSGKGLTLKDSSASPGFSIYDRPQAPGHQVNFVSNAPVTGAGAVMNIFAAASSATSKNISQLSLWTVPPTAVSAVQGAIRAITGSTGEELHLLTQRFGTTALTAGDIVFKPNNVEQFRVIAGVGANVVGTLTINGVPVSTGGGGATPPVIRAHSSALFNAASVVVPWPAGTVAGDVVVIFTENGWTPNVPAGWLQVQRVTSGSAQGMCIAKVMTAADITAASVTITYSGGFNGSWVAITLKGTTMGGIDFSASGTGTASPTAMSGQSKLTNLTLVFAAYRSNGIVSITGDVSLENSAGSNASFECGTYAGIDPLGYVNTNGICAVSGASFWCIASLRGP